MNLPFFIAKRYLISKKSHNAINIISGISVAGICIGTMALIIVLSAFNGLSDLVQSLYNSFDADIEITLKQGKTFIPDPTEFQSLKKIEGIAYYTEVMEGNALLKLNDKQCIATIKGVSTDFERMTDFDSLVSEGEFNLEKSNIVIGKGISYILQNGPNDLFTPISVYAPKRGNVSTFDAEGGLNELKAYPAGAFSINDEFDYKYVLMNIHKARELFDYTTEVSSIELGIADGFDKEKIEKQIHSLLSDKYEIKNRQQQNALLYKTLKSEKLWTFIILVFILIIATFNVIGSLTMLIIEKKKDITILHNMGADIQLIRRIFLMEGLLITIIGAALGLILGTFVCWLQIKFSLIRFTEGYVVDAYPIKLEITDFVMITGAVLLIGFFAAWYPVRIFTKRHLAF
ncbi:MAG: FtsX-like permease family protein [Bacteroidetes bacterium]|nr:FtsX-like permease family protein [Bacteroidota bacterium]